jgi:hypothetical protein
MKSEALPADFMNWKMERILRKDNLAIKIFLCLKGISIHAVRNTLWYRLDLVIPEYFIADMKKILQINAPKKDRIRFLYSVQGNGSQGAVR